VRVGFSTRSLSNLNRADVIAAMEAWMGAITKERKLAFKADCVFYDSPRDMENALRRSQVDIVSASTDDFLSFEKVIPLTGLVSSKVNGSITEAYVLLVHVDQSAKEFRDLSGKSILVLDNARTTLAPCWLDVELLRRKLPVATRFFGKVTYVTKPSQAILPVFFKHAEAALVTRANFNTAVELNPQLAKSVRIMALSPELIPEVSAVRANVMSEAVDLYQKEVKSVHQSAGGKQILNLFQIDSLIEIQPSDLVGTRTLLAEYARLRPRGRESLNPMLKGLPN
jgi:hypothetical protein